MVIFTILALEEMRTKFTLFDSKMQMIGLEICFIIPGKVAIVFNFMRSTILNILKALTLISESCVFSLLIVFVLRNTRIYIYTSNDSNIAYYIKESVNEYFSK